MLRKKLTPKWKFNYAEWNYNQIFSQRMQMTSLHNAYPVTAAVAKRYILLMLYTRSHRCFNEYVIQLSSVRVLQNCYYCFHTEIMHLIRATKNCNRCRVAYMHRLHQMECFYKQRLAPYGFRRKTTLALTTTEVHGIPNEQCKRNILRATITFRRRKSLACGVLQLFVCGLSLQCLRKRFPL